MRCCGRKREREPFSDFREQGWVGMQYGFAELAARHELRAGVKQGLYRLTRPSNLGQPCVTLPQGAHKLTPDHHAQGGIECNPQKWLRLFQPKQD